MACLTPWSGEACLSSLLHTGDRAAHPAPPHPYVDPHAGDLLVHHVRLDIPGHSSGEGHPLLFVLSGRNEQGRGQKDKLKPLLGPVQEHGPGTERAEEKPGASGTSRGGLLAS